MERFAFILGLVGLALSLIAFDANRLHGAQHYLFNGGVALLVVSVLMVVWPAVRAGRRMIVRRVGPIPVERLFAMAIAAGWQSDKTDNREMFMAILAQLTMSGEIELLGRLRGEALEPVPPSHFPDYELVMIPRMTGGFIVRTIKPSDWPTNPHDPYAYDRLHVTRAAVAKIPRFLAYQRALAEAESAPAEASLTAGTSEP